jgi:hypothetical protein
MKVAGFWISRHPFPDKALLTQQEITSFNSRIENGLRLTEDITRIGPAYPGQELATVLAQGMEDLRKKKLYRENGSRVDTVFYQRIKEAMNLKGIPQKVNVQYGLVVHYADQRLLPTEEILSVRPGDIDFDELQNSSLDVGTPLVILHQSLDGLWLYGKSASSTGWVKAEQVAICGSAQYKGFMGKAPFVVVISPKAEIFLDPHLTNYYDYVRMGTRFPCQGDADSGRMRVLVPLRNADGTLVLKTAYMRREDVSIGYLPYTPRTIIQQAFKLLNAPYGWGGVHGEQDCSAFIQEVFATVGIALPRNSVDQARVGRLGGEFSEKADDGGKLALLAKEGIGGITFLYLKGHILLFLGMYEDRPYAIHATWGYRQSADGQEVVRVINRVAVTDLFLGEGSSKGSLLRRLKTIRIIDTP